MTNTWWMLREALVLIESAEYRGTSGMRFDDLISLTVSAFGLRDDPQKGPAKDQARRMLNTSGGALDCNHEFNRKIWRDWSPKANVALAKSATDSAKRGNQYPGEPKGGTVMKKNYGGRVIYQPGGRDKSHEQMPSAMDTYDVLMRADGDVLTRYAYAPSQGQFEERAARLEDLMGGRSALPLRRRAQPEKPEPSKDDVEKWDRTHPSAQPVRRVGQNLKAPKKDPNEE